jgi:hypothetical protein
MIKNSRTQNGSVHVIITITLVVVTLGLLGFVFWQNFIVKDDQLNTTVTQNPSRQKTEASTKEFKSQDNNITFRYPADWSVDEDIDTGSTANWYASYVRVLNAQNKVVSSLSTGGELGGLCSEEAPLVPISTIIKDSLELEGIGSTNFGYTIVETDTDNYGVAFGLLENDPPHDNDLQLGDSLVSCPGMSVNYRYYIKSNTTALGGIVFGLRYAEAPQEGDPKTYRMFKTLDEAKAYATSAEFKQIEKMIKSLSIGKVNV